MKRNEMKLLLEERFERIALLETRIDTLEQLIEGYREREQAILNTLQAAKENAAKMTEQAGRDAEETRAAANRDAEETRTAAKRDAETLRNETLMTTEALKAEAENLVKEMLSSSKAESERMLRDAEITKREYEEMCETFNATLEQNASELQSSTARFAEFLKNRKIDPPEMRDDGNAFYKSVGALSDEALPDPGDDPARLMQNIYHIQNRPLPENPAEEDDASKEAQNAAEPFSEAAWNSQEQMSESEPQAEFTQVFDEAFADTDFTVRADGCHLDHEDAEREVDAFLSDGAFAPPRTDAQEAPEPTDAIAAAAADTEGDHTNAQQAFDEFYHQSINNNTNDNTNDNIQPVAVYAEAAEAVSPIDKLDELFSKQIPETPEEPPEQAETQPLVAPEPYSEASWAQRILKSEREPQAEFSGAYAAKDDIPDAVLTVGLINDDAQRAFDDFLDASAESSVASAALPAEPVPTEEATPVPEPFSEAAWSLDAYTSQQEPQAESSAESADTEVEATAPSTAADAERAFDELMDGVGGTADEEPKATETAPVGETASVPEPFSEEAWSLDAYTSQQEPQAEFSAAVDAESADAEAEVTAPSTAADAERAFDELMDGAGGTADEEPMTTEPAPAPEPFSEAAWSLDAYTSRQEPQAEFSAESVETEVEPTEPSTAADAERAFDELMDGAGETADEEPKASEAIIEPQIEEEEPEPAPRRYNEFGELREWEPEPEPEMEEIPTVSNFVGTDHMQEEVTLDQLLDEIIKAGD